MRTKSFLIAALLMISLLALSPIGSAFADDDAAKILVLTGKGFGHSYFPLKEEMDSRGWKHYRVGVEKEYAGCYNRDQSITLTSDLLIKDIQDLSKYDCLIVPSGPQFREFVKNDEVKSFIRRAYDEGLIVCSFCAGNVLINATGLLGQEGHKLLSPAKVIEPKPKLLIGPRGGGPARNGGNGYEGLNIKMICDAIEVKLPSVTHP